MLSLGSSLPAGLSDRKVVTSRPAIGAEGDVAALGETKRWVALAVASLVIAGLLSLAVVVGRLPVLSRIIDDPLFFKRCLVVHVDLALVVWFYAFLAGLMTLRTTGGTGKVGALAFWLGAGGVGAMLAGALVRGAEPILANYVPVIDHPLFGAGLTLFFGGGLLFFIQSLARRGVQRRADLPADAAIGLQAAAVMLVIAAATWVSARAGLPPGVDAHTKAEFLAWGPGHVLQAANAAAMLAVWLWLLARVSGRPVLSARAARGLFALLVVPQLAMPLLTMRGTLDTLYHSGATQLMRWGIFPAVMAGLVAGVRHLLSLPREGGAMMPGAGAARVGFHASAGLAVLGIILGACIRGSTTLVPAHYHASLGAVTVAFMAAAYGINDLFAQREGGRGWTARRWRAAAWQLGAFGVGQAVFAGGFAIGGAYGLGRKMYAAEQHVRSAGEVAGLIVMGVGGLIAAAAGVWFLFMIVRSMRGWWRRGATARAAQEFSSVQP